MYDRFRSLLFRLEAERAHQAGFAAARLAQAVSLRTVEPMFEYEHEALRQQVLGLTFENPVGLAAGFDKNAQLVRFWEAVGFGFAEVGSVSAQPSKGNPRPRAFRLPEDRALINRMGLNNHGARRVAKRLRRRAGRRERPLGVNLAKTHDPAIMGEAAVDDFRESFCHLAPWADYVALNISCPNTREGKTFESADALDALLGAVLSEREALSLEVPVLLKLSPSLTPNVVFDSRTEEVLEVARRHGVDGFIATNTASEREGLQTSEERLEAIGRGGLSGAPLEERATHLVRYLYRETGGAVPVIGVGGVGSAESAYAKIRAGASLVQLYTALVYEGPGLIRRIKEGLVELLERDGFASVQEAVGVDA